MGRRDTAISTSKPGIASDAPRSLSAPPCCPIGKTEAIRAPYKGLVQSSPRGRWKQTQGRGCRKSAARESNGPAGEDGIERAAGVNVPSVGVCACVSVPGMLVERRGTTERKPAVVAGTRPLSKSPGGESNGLRDIGHIQEELAAHASVLRGSPRRVEADVPCVRGSLCCPGVLGVEH